MAGRKAGHFRLARLVWAGAPPCATRSQSMTHRSRHAVRREYLDVRFHTSVAGAPA